MVSSTLEEQCKSLSDVGIPINNLFMQCCFHLVGFEEDEWMKNPNQNNNNLPSLSKESKTKTIETKNDGGKQDLLRLIRKGMGTIFWDVHESITHVIVADGSDAKLRLVHRIFVVLFCLLYCTGLRINFFIPLHTEMMLQTFVAIILITQLQLHHVG